MKKFLLFLSIIFISPTLEACSGFAYGGVFPFTGEPHAILCKREFAVGYSLVRKTPLFVVQRIDTGESTAPKATNNSSFRLNPNFPAESQASLNDYVGSGFDRGHLSAFEDNNHDAIAARESGYLTNVVPQVPGNNRGIWRVLESQVREMALDGPIYVVTGVVFSPDSNAFIGDNIPIPTYLYKVVINPAKQTSTTWIVPNMSVPSSELPNFISKRSTIMFLSGVDVAPILSINESLR